MRRSIQRGFVVATAVAGLCVSGTVAATAAQADARPSADRAGQGDTAGSAAADALHGVTRTTRHVRDASPAARTPAQQTVRTVEHAVGSGTDDRAGRTGGAGAAEDVGAAEGVRGGGDAAVGKVVKSVRTARPSGEVRHGVGKAVAHVPKKAREAVSEAPSGASHQTARHAVSGVQTASPASSVPGMPEDYVIGVPKVVPGVPSVGIVPLSLPQVLPFTPSVPIG